MISSFLHIISQALCRASYGSLNMVVSADPLGGAEGLRWAGNGSPFSRSCLGTCCVRARLPSIPPPAQTCSRHGAASAGGSACMWGGDTWLPTLYLITPHMLATGPTAFRSPGSPGVCPACLQGVVGRSVARQNTELHEDRADRGAQRAQLCLHHRPVCWGPFPAKPSVGLPLPSLGPPTAPGTFPVECGHHEEVRPYGGAGAWPVELISPSLGDSEMFWSLWPCSKQPSAGYAHAYARDQITNFLCITNFYFY